ncbi:serine/threonine-protein kinase bud32 [Ascosphaera atra]|nr:serine/threonine-protein kinase bud32 [Ascosphaera atra]
MPAALKMRLTKPYRHPILDKRLTRARILQEARCLVKLSRILDDKEDVSVPGVYALECDKVETSCVNFGEVIVEQEHGDLRHATWMLMEWIPGPTVRDVVERWERWMKEMERQGRARGDPLEEEKEEVKRSEKEMVQLLRRMGRAVGALHKVGVVHGDLTTSNLILRQEGKEVTAITSATVTEPTMTPPGRLNMEGSIALIDFGLASQSMHEEDRAVDLYVLERAFGSSHPRAEKLFGSEVLGKNGYASSYKGANVVLKRLADVRLRGRKRSMIG